MTFQDHSYDWNNQDSNLGLSDSKACFFTMRLLIGGIEEINYEDLEQVAFGKGNI